MHALTNVRRTIDILAVIMAWWITFNIVTSLIMSLGFGPVGVVGGELSSPVGKAVMNTEHSFAGSVAAIFQSVMYGAFTPAAGIFATLTSIAMGGTIFWPAPATGGIVATIVASIVWAAGAGR